MTVAGRDPNVPEDLAQPQHQPSIETLAKLIAIFHKNERLSSAHRPPVGRVCSNIFPPFPDDPHACCLRSLLFPVAVTNIFLSCPTTPEPFNCAASTSRPSLSRNEISSPLHEALITTPSCPIYPHANQSVVVRTMRPRYATQVHAGHTRIVSGRK